MPDAPFRYKKLGYVAINVADLERTVTFYRDVVGMEVSEYRKGEVAYMRCGDDYHSLAFFPAAQPGVKRMAFELESDEDLEAARRHLKSLGVSYTAVPAAEARDLRHRESIRFNIPGCGMPMELFSGAERQVKPFAPTRANLLRLGHIVIKVKEFDTTFAWLTDKFGFRVSDHIRDDKHENEIAFMRCYPNPYHHSLGIARSDANQLHHYALMVRDLDDIGRGNNRLPREGAPVVFGPGRHVASGSVFLYFLDPDGITLEYTHGMEEFSERTPRAARMLEPKLEVVDMWLGTPRAGFGRVGYAEGANH
ncbi:MAG: hypothetical protein EXR39_01885 [Betaproteobacteria bacterium]|nr:hypothetical protein [Betaproteobacteria bacterium]